MTDLKSILMDEVVIGMLVDLRTLREDMTELNTVEYDKFYWELHSVLMVDLRRVIDKYNVLRTGDSDALKQLDWLLEPQVKWAAVTHSFMRRQRDAWTVECEEEHNRRLEIQLNMEIEDTWAEMRRTCD